MLIVLAVLIVLLLAGGGGYVGHQHWGQTYPYAGGGISVGTILLVVFVAWLFGLFR